MSTSLARRFSNDYQKICEILDNPGPITDRKLKLRDLIQHLQNDIFSPKYCIEDYDRIFLFAATSYVEVGDGITSIGPEWKVLIRELLYQMRRKDAWPSVNALIDLITCFNFLPTSSHNRLIGKGETDTENVVYCMHSAVSQLADAKHQTEMALKPIRTFLTALQDYEKSHQGRSALQIQYTDEFDTLTANPAVKKLFVKLSEYISEDVELAIAQLECVYAVLGYDNDHEPNKPYVRYTPKIAIDRKIVLFIKRCVDSHICYPESVKWIQQILSDECAERFVSMDEAAQRQTVWILSKIYPAGSFHSGTWNYKDPKWVAEWAAADGHQFAAHHPQIMDAIILYAFGPLCAFRIGTKPMLDVFRFTVENLLKSHQHVLSARAHLQILFYMKAEADMQDVVINRNKWIIPILGDVYGADGKWKDLVKVDLVKAFNEQVTSVPEGEAPRISLSELQERLEIVFC